MLHNFARGHLILIKMASKVAQSLKEKKVAKAQGTKITYIHLTCTLTRSSLNYHTSDAVIVEPVTGVLTVGVCPLFFSL